MSYPALTGEAHTGSARPSVVPSPASPFASDPYAPYCTVKQKFNSKALKYAITDTVHYDHIINMNQTPQ